MRLTYLYIRNFKSIRSMEIRNIDRVLIFAGKNNTGKTSILDAVYAVYGCCGIQARDFDENCQAIRVDACFSIEEEDLHLLHHMGIVSQYRRYDVWRRVLSEWLPSLKDRELSFIPHVNQDDKVRYEDLYRKDNSYTHVIVSRICRVNTERGLNQLQNDLLTFQEDEELRRLHSGNYIFKRAKKCNHCFQCTSLINWKKSEELSAFETVRLLGFKMYQLSPIGFSKEVNKDFSKNGGYEKIQYTLNFDADQLFTVKVTTHNRQRGSVKSMELMGEGMRSICILSLLETYISEQGKIPGIIMVEDPEIFLYPQFQKFYSEILHRLSKKNQVIFKTHSPDLLFNLSIHQIQQVVLDDGRYSVICPRTNTGEILDDLGYGANDLSNVSFMLIMEGKQDKGRLPLLLERYYSEAYDEAGSLYRISIITISSCTNIKTYTNSKYMNQIYPQDQFLMMRDRDGKDPEELASQLCRYYDERNSKDVDHLPKMTKRSVLILRYYSFENYLSDPAVMVRLEIVESKDTFYQTLYGEWREYLYRIRSGQQLTEVLGRDFSPLEDMKEHMEEVHIYLRGHNLYDIFYGPFRGREKEILKTYIDLAPKEDFKDILGAIDRFVYSDSGKRPGN